MKQGIRIVIILFSLTTPAIVSAERVDWQDATTASGNYIDLQTSLVYHYDAGLGVLHPAGVNGQLEDFAHITPSSCGEDCVSFVYDAKVTGNHFLAFNIQNFPNGLPAGRETQVGEGVQGGALVTALAGGSIGNTAFTGSGRVQATITSDGAYIAWANQTY